MNFENARQIASGARLSTDICVIGSGAAGIALAHQLDGSNLDVIVLEAGGLERDLATEQDTYAIDELGEPFRNPIEARGRWFGGSTNLWFGRIAVPDRIDFERRPWVRHSGWPIGYDDLQPWLRTAADILAVPHFDKMDLGQWSTNPTIETFVTRGAANLGVFLWADGLFMGPAHRATLKQSRNVRLVLEATATELVPNETSTCVQSLAVSGPAGNRFHIDARRYVLATGGFENPRLLLASTRVSASGIGNAHDNVGRYYLDHPRGEGLARVDLRGLTTHQIEKLALLGEKAQSAYGKVQLRVMFPEQMQRDEQLLNNSLHAHLVSDVHQSEGYASARRLQGRLRRGSSEPVTSVPRDLVTTLRAAPQLAAFAVQALRRRVRPTELVVVDQMEQEPDALSRVTVNPRQRDRFGLPRLELDWRISASTYRSQRRMHRFFKDILEREGIRSFTSEVLERPHGSLPLWDMKHPMGTTRMSASPTDGVVDAACRVHGMTNLFVVGSSVFPTGGHANPTLLIVALAARLAAHLKLTAER